MLIGDSLPEYVLIRAAIIALRLIAPISLLYSIFFISIQPRDLLRHRGLIILDIWMFAEALFFLCVYIPLGYLLQSAARHPEPLCKEDRQSLIKRCVDLTPDPEVYLSKWLLESPTSEIKRENVKEFYAWSLMDKTYEKTNAAEKAELDLYVDQLEERLGRSFEDGWGKAQALKLTLEPVPMQHRPLIWYAVVFVVECYSSIRLLTHSFHHHRISLTRSVLELPFRLFAYSSWRTSPSQMVSYWHRKHASKSKAPILFIHGIGIGLYACVDFLIELNAGHDDSYDGDIGIIAVEIMPISSRISPPALSAVEMKEEIRKILDTHGWNEIVLVGHSYGSGIAANMLRDPETAKYVKSAVLMDPISLMLHLPHVAYNFTRRKPSRASEHMLYYFSSQDMMISHTLARRFFWKEFILFKEDIPPGMPLMVTLSGKDIIVPSRDVWEYLTEASRSEDNDGRPKGDTEWEFDNLKVVWFDKLNHAGVFNSKGARRGIASAVRQRCERDRQTVVEER